MDFFVQFFDALFVAASLVPITKADGVTLPLALMSCI